MRILLVEDDEEIGENLVKILSQASYAVDLVNNLEEAEERILSGEYDGMICDRKLPDGDGLKLVAKIRSEQLSIPVLMLTAKSAQRDIVEGLDLGADDYLTKPFSKNVLLARVRAVLRRSKRFIPKPILKFDQLEINIGSREVKYLSKLIPLAPKEYEVLLFLAEHPNEVVERMEILTHVWNDEIDLFSNTVDVHIRYLRKKLSADIIKTVRGKGYMLCE